MSLGIFLGVLTLYLAKLPPVLAPWRDTGEMSVAVSTLGVAHPTSYPLYILLGRLASLFPLGNTAYRLNLLSAVAGAAACALLFAVLRRRHGMAASLAAGICLAFNPTFWAVSQVSEMYSLWVLAAIGLIALAERLAEDDSERLWPAFCYLAGILLTNRLDLILLAPGLLWLALAHRPKGQGEDNLWVGMALLLAPAAAALSGSNVPAALLIGGTFLARTRGEGAARRLALGIGAGLAGLSVYLYLPVRSATGPFLDWNHPAKLANFMDSILRTRYGGTLDLISRNYGVGEMFGENLRLWGSHLWDAFGPMLAFAGLGAIVDYREDRGRFYGRLVSWWWAGPVFLFLANMPPNPHAAAIVEPHYLLSDTVLLFWLAGGVGILDAANWRRAVVPALVLVWALARGVPTRLDRRAHFHSHDYAANVFRAAPLGAVVVAKKDVQVYALWHYQLAQGRRRDLRLIAQGLAGSPWYQADWRRRDKTLFVSNLAGADGWSALGASGAPVLATYDAQPPAAVADAAKARGLLQAVSGVGGDDGTQRALLVRRGARRVAQASDFFTSDLIGGYALAYYREALRLQKEAANPQAELALSEAWAVDWNFPDAVLFAGYLQANAGRFSEAAATYALADGLFAEKLSLAERYRSLPALVSSVRSQAAESATHHGVVLEKLGDKAGAEGQYRRALGLFPLAQTRYNLAVLSWGADWAAVEEHLTEALRLDPTHADARKYLAALRMRRR
jgi:tetratricopeptide (TPR) repeat protein